MNDNSEIEEKRPTEDVLESDTKAMTHETGTCQGVPDRRRLFQKLVSLAALGGLASLLLGEQPPKASAGLHPSLSCNKSLVWFDSGSPACSWTEDVHFMYDNVNMRLGVGIPLDIYNSPGNPEQALHVAGVNPRVLIADTTGTSNSEVNFRTLGDADNQVWALYKKASTGDLCFLQGGDKITIQNGTGNVGIGTSTPLQLLHLYGSSPRILIDGTGTSNSEVNFRTVGDTGDKVWALYKNGSTGDLGLYQGGDKITIQNGTGNVGIGTTTPSSMLHVLSNSGYAVLGQSPLIGVRGETSGQNGIGVYGLAISGPGVRGYSAAGPGVIGYSAAGPGVVSMGNLGVGTSSPGFDVHVLGTTDPASVTVDAVGIVGPNFMFRRARGTVGVMSAVQQNDGLLFLVAKGYGASGFSSTGRANISMYAAENWTDTAQGTYMSFKTTQAETTTQTEKMRITDTGNVGIGTITPKSPLHVVGLPVYANNAAAIAGGLTAGALYRNGADPDPVCVVH